MQGGVFPHARGVFPRGGVGGGPKSSFLPRDQGKQTTSQGYPVYFRSAGLEHGLGSCRPGKLTEKGKIPKVLGGGCKRSFGPREQRSPKSLLHHPKLLLHWCKKGLHRCKGLCAPWVQKTFCTPPLSTFGNFPLSVSFPGPQLPKTWVLKRGSLKSAARWQESATFLQRSFSQRCKSLGVSRWSLFWKLYGGH